MPTTPNHEGANNGAFENYFSVITRSRIKIAVHTVFERTCGLGKNRTTKRSHRINVGFSEACLNQGTSNQLFRGSATPCQSGENYRGNRPPYLTRFLVTN